MKIKHLFITLLLVVFAVSVANAAVTDITPWKMAERNQPAIGYIDTLSVADTSTDTLFVDGIHGKDNNAENITFCVTITGITTNAVIRIVNGHASNRLGNVDEDGTDTTITADGTYNFTIQDIKSKGYFALYFVSESGGTDAVIIVSVKVG